MRGGINWRALRRGMLWALALGLFGGAVSANDAPPGSAPSRPPLVFEPNLGQSESPALFLARGAGQTVFFARDEVVVVFDGPGSAVAPHPVRVSLAGGNEKPEVVAGKPLPGKSNYYRGRGDSWTVGVPHYGNVRYEGVYDGVDVVYYGNRGRLEYDFLLAPGASPEQIRLEFDGIDGLVVDAAGDLVLATPAGEVRLHRPVTYQEAGSAREPVASEYVVLAESQVGFKVADYDRARQLVIDPILGYSTFFGGDAEDNGGGVHVDDTGIYFGGLVGSTDMGADFLSQTQSSGGLDAFAAKLDPTGEVLLYATYFGGSGTEVQRDLVADDLGNAYLLGETVSVDLPVTLGAHDSTCGVDGACDGGLEDIFVAKLTPSGALAYATYIGGSDKDIAGKVDVDGFDNVYLSGYTRSTDFPATPGAHDTTCGTDGTCNGGQWDALVVSVDTTGSSLNYATFLGGSFADRGFALAVDHLGRAHVAGSTFSADFPATPGAYDRSCGIDGACDGVDDAFIVRLSATGASLDYATYLGGQGDGTSAPSDERVWAIALDDAGNAYVTGQTDSADFPTVNALYADFGGGLDGFVAKLSVSGSALLYSTYLGGSGDDEGFGIDVDRFGNVVVAGATDSKSDFPLVDPLGAPGNQCVMCELGFQEAFAARINADGSALLYATFLGGDSAEFGADIAAWGSGGAVMLGDTFSTVAQSFPTVDPVQAVHGDGANWDTFVVRIESDDTDGDGVKDPTDNCLETLNRLQHDTDGDGFGNLCDADLNNDLVVNILDLGLFRSRFLTNDPHADFNGDGFVNIFDLGIFRTLFLSPPGPSGRVGGVL